MKLSDLHNVFVSFETEQLEGCSVVYFNESLAEGKTSAQILDDYSYAVNPQVATSSAQLATKTFMAERYGGDGILSNGGGGRCGFDGVWQLKGLGPNELVGKDVDIGHSDGNLALHIALYESVWSEIIHAVLPFGAIRTVAILDTGRKYESRGRLIPRGLLVRQPVVRPAHFIRAVYFKEQHLNVLGKDARRVKQAIARLVDFLPCAGAMASTSSVCVRLQHGLLELAGRYAEQFAAARARHIIHFNVSASNLSLDGAWLDLSSTCLFNHLVTQDRVDVDRFNTEQFPALESLQNLCYYLSKYSVVTVDESRKLFEETTSHFAQAYDTNLRIYQVAQAGFPFWILRELVDSAEFEAFSGRLHKVLKLDEYTVDAMTFGDGWHGYERWTARLYTALLSSRDTPASVADWSWLNMGMSAIHQLQSTFSQLCDLALRKAAEHKIDPQNFYRCMAINMTRLNQSHTVLHDVEARIEAISASELSSKDKKAAYEALSEEAVLAAKLSLASDQQQRVPFWLSRALSIWFDPRSGLFTLVDDEGRLLSIEDLIALGENRPDVSAALHFYDRVLSSLHEKTV